jgi:hypothetical protein
MHNTADRYVLFGKTFTTFEIDEICVANKTMSFKDYQDCRLFDLTVEIFYNNAIFYELLKFIQIHNLSMSKFIRNIHETIHRTPGPLAYLYDGFLKETGELWKERKEIDSFLNQPGVLDRYISGELGNNEQLMYRTRALLENMDVMHEISFNTAFEMMKENGKPNDQYCDYLKELADFSLSIKKDIFCVEKETTRFYHYDFVTLSLNKFNANPLKYYKEEGISIRFHHTDEQKDLISKYTKIYNNSIYGLGNIISAGANLSELFRKVSINL